MNVNMIATWMSANTIKKKSLKAGIYQTFLKED